MLTVDHIRDNVASNFNLIHNLTSEQIEEILERADELDDSKIQRQVRPLLFSLCYDRPFFGRINQDYSNPNPNIRRIKAALALYFLEQHYADGN